VKSSGSPQSTEEVNMNLSFEEIEAMDAPEPWYIIVGDIVIIIGAAIVVT
jgi:hypothetical protein